MKVAVFDVCGTIYQSNTTFDFLSFIYRGQLNGVLWKMVIRSIPGKVIGYLFYRYGKYDIYREVGTKLLRRFSVAELDQKAILFVENFLSKKQNNEVIKKIKLYRQQGYKIVFISGSYNFIIRRIAEALGADDYFGSRLNQNEQHYLGGYLEDLQGEKVKVLAENYPNRSHLVVFTDNSSDLSLLRLANAPFVVVNNKRMLPFWEKHLPKATLIFPKG